MKYSKRVREEAALICAIAASSRWEGSRYTDWFTTWKAGEHVEASRTAMRLADLAWFSVNHLGRAQEVYAEAEALIRCGWSPS